MENWRTSDFDYQLPEALIAQRPVERGRSRLLVVDAEAGARHRSVADLPQLLRPGDLLIVNDTRVIPARMFARRRPGGGRVELLLVEKSGPREWEVLAKPARRLRTGSTLELADGELIAEVVAVGDDGRRRLRFDSDIEPHLERCGHVPLPPYIRRDDASDDRQRYQTIFARQPGAIAAPTAGLHFDDELMAALATRGVERAAVTLHVGLGTFRPVTVDRIADHQMEAERFEISSATAAAIQTTRAAGGRVVAVGTTVVRTLESAAAGDGEVRAGSGRTELFITPGFQFQVVDALLTNFHLPRSTLLMLVSALAGQGRPDGERVGRERVLAAYREAIAEEYRFYSYGDAMFLERFRARD
ncbi:MAG: tRNA preQ1(34) S-adenosylmethionine ribosyltransferase-isomerase QueA [Acidobacteriota bacterium]